MEKLYRVDMTTQQVFSLGEFALMNGYGLDSTDFIQDYQKVYENSMFFVVKEDGEVFYYKEKIKPEGSVYAPLWHRTQDPQIKYPLVERAMQQRSSDMYPDEVKGKEYWLPTRFAHAKHLEVNGQIINWARIEAFLTVLSKIEGTFTGPYSDDPQDAVAHFASHGEHHRLIELGAVDKYTFHNDFIYAYQAFDELGINANERMRTV